MSLTIGSNEVIVPQTGYTHENILSKSIRWCREQQPNRLLWVGIILMVQACVVTPLTMSFLLMAGLPFTWIALSLAPIAAAVITNLAALDTYITIPVFFISVAADLTIVGFSMYTILNR